MPFFTPSFINDHNQAFLQMQRAIRSLDARMDKPASRQRLHGWNIKDSDEHSRRKESNSDIWKSLLKVAMEHESSNIY